MQKELHIMICLIITVNVTLGVPRIKEIINATKNISTPIITARLIEEDPKLGMQVKNYLQETLLREVCTHMNTVIMQDDYFILVHLSEKAMKKRGVSIHGLIVNLAAGLKASKFRYTIPLQSISICPGDIIRIKPPQSKTSTAFFVMQNLIKVLPSIAIKVSFFYLLSFIIMFNAVNYLKY